MNKHPQINIALITLFPEMFTALDSGITGRALKNKLVELHYFNPRDFTQDKHRTVDDRPYGGGPGMVMLYQPLHDAVNKAKQTLGANSKTIYLSPQGKPLTQAKVAELAQAKNLILVSGRYEGVDERFIESDIDEEISIGDFVLSGGELPTMAMIDAIIRLIPGALGHEDSAQQDSFSNGLLDCPHYTRPEDINGMKVPEVLLSGNHKAIASWRHEQSLARTKKRRPELADMKLD